MMTSYLELLKKILLLNKNQINKYRLTQVEHSGHRIPPEHAGNKRKSHRILQECTGNRRNWKQYSNGNFQAFFRWIQANFLGFPTGSRSEIIGKNPKIFRWEYCFHVPAISSVFLPEPARIFWLGDNVRINFCIYII